MVISGKEAKIIELSDSISEISNINMGGCKEWNCIIRSHNSDHIIDPLAEAILINSMGGEYYQQNTNKYYIFFTQVIHRINHLK